ncbi:MAG: beta strand repeat-containing protein [Chthoniobacterales bacterium]
MTSEAASNVLWPSMKPTAILAGALFLMFAAQSSHAQTTWFWRNGESRGNNWGATDRWWNGSSGATLTASSSLNTFLSFDGSTELTSTNDVSNAGVRGILFGSGGSSRTLNGNTLRIAEGGVGKIENNSGNTQTINLTLSNNTTNGLEINPVNGRLNLTNVHLGSNYADLYGASTVEFRGQISGSAVFTLKAASGAVIALLSASNTMTGRFDLDRGFLVLNSTNATAGTGTINIGRSSTGDSAEFQIAPSAALVNNIVNGINFNSTTGAGSTRAIASLNTSGTNVVTGTVTNNASGLVAKLYQANGGTLRFSNVVSGAGGFYLENGSGSGGTVELSAANTFSGGFFIDNGTLKITDAAATAGSGTLGLGQTGSGSNAILRLSGAAGGITLTNSSLDVRTGGGQRQIISENTSGTNSFNGGMSTANNLTFDVATGGTLRLAGNVTNTTTVTNIKSGSGTLIYAGATTGGTGNQLKVGNGAIVIGLNNAGTTNTGTSTRAIDLGLDGTNGITANNVGLYASNAVTVSNSVFVAANTGGASRTIGISGAGSATFNNEIFLGGNLTVDAGANATDQVTMSGNILNTSGLIKTNAGILLLSGSGNTFTGGVTLGSGTLRVGNNSALGTGTFTINGGTFASDSSAARTITNAITMGGNVQFGDATGTGALTLSNIDLGTATRTFTVSNSTTVVGTITNTGGLTKTGSGTMTLAASNSYSGATDIQGGRLTLSGNGRLGSGAITISNADTGTLQLAVTGTNVMANNISGAGALVSSAGETRITGAVTTTGGLTVSSSTVRIGNGGTSGSFSGNTTLSDNTAQLVFDRSDAYTHSGTISGSGSVTKSGAGTTTLTGSNNSTGATAVTGGVLNLNSSSGSSLGSTASVSVTNATLLVSQSNQVSNGATVSLSGGTIAKGSGAISETFGALTLIANSTLDFGSGGTGNFTFSTYNPASFVLKFDNFGAGNSLTVTTGTFNASQFNFNSFGYTQATDGAGFTITAIPEPSTVLAALGLTVLMLWPARRRLVRDALSILGLRAPMRDRLASRHGHA